MYRDKLETKFIKFLHKIPEKKYLMFNFLDGWEKRCSLLHRKGAVGEIEKKKCI